MTAPEVIESINEAVMARSPPTHVPGATGATARRWRRRTKRRPARRHPPRRSRQADFDECAVVALDEHGAALLDLVLEEELS